MCRTSHRYIQRGYDNETEEGKWRVERETLEDFASTVVSHSSSSIRSLLERIHSIVAPQQRRGSRLQGPGIFAQLTGAMHVSLSWVNLKPSARSETKHQLSNVLVDWACDTLQGSNRWIWSSDEIISGRVNRSIRRTICSTTTLSTTNFT